MPGNTFGQIFRVTTFGASHGPAIGCVVDGCPAGLALSIDDLQQDLDRRRPGQSALTTSRQEADRVELLSGVFEGRTTGDPIALLIRNQDARSEDYDHLKDVFRPGHADIAYHLKYGNRDHRGGGRASARETAARVAAGAIAKQLLAREGVQVRAWVAQVGPVALDIPYTELDLSAIEGNPVRCPHPDTAEQMMQAIEVVRAAGDTLGGSITCLVKGCPPGLGEPVFDKLEADLAKAMLSLPAAKGFGIGSGFEAAGMKGSQHNEPLTFDGSTVSGPSVNSGGVLGGISTGQDILFRVAFKPVSTLMQDREAIDIHGNSVTLPPKGRHDPSVVPRAVPIVEAMAAIVLADHWLRNRSLNYPG